MFPSVVGQIPTMSEFPIGHPLTSIFNGVEHYPQTEFVKLERSMSLLHRRQEYSFWYAISMVMYDDHRYWAEIKETVFAHTASIIRRAGEPRCEAYMAATKYASETRFPYGHFRDQLEADSQIQGAPYMVCPVGPEIWQFVADSLKIELLVIIAHVPANPK